MAERRVLHSWKEISNYTGRGIRTIQRYELQSGFPVHRPAGKARSAVLAFSDEIDAWLKRGLTRPHPMNAASSVVKIEQTRRYLAVAAKAKRSEEVARTAYESCMEQASRVREMMLKMGNLRTASLNDSIKGASRPRPSR